MQLKTDVTSEMVLRLIKPQQAGQRFDGLLIIRKTGEQKPTNPPSTAPSDFFCSFNRDDHQDFGWMAALPERLRLLFRGIRFIPK